MNTTQVPELDFASVLASSVHDMKNSLCMVIQSMENLSDSLGGEESEHAAEIAHLHYEVSRLNSNLLQMLALYRVHRQHLPVTIEQQYIDELLDDIVAKNDLYIRNRKIDLALEVEEDLSWYLDQGLIGSLLNDALSNALRYTKSKIKISAQKNADGALEICIEDDGTGYPDAMLQLQSKPMSEIDLMAGRTGLGLYFARLIAQQHNNNNQQGYIQLSNGGSLGGSVFKAILP